MSKNIVSELKFVVNEKNIKYVDKQVCSLIKLYKNNDYSNDILLRLIQEKCYPIILGAFKKYLDNSILKGSQLTDKNELLSEAFIILNDCIKSYNEKKAGFITHFWGAMNRRFGKAVAKNDRVVKNSKRKNYKRLVSKKNDNETGSNIVSEEEMASLLYDDPDKTYFNDIETELKHILTIKEFDVYYMLVNEKLNREEICKRCKITKWELQKILKNIKVAVKQVM